MLAGGNQAVLHSLKYNQQLSPIISLLSPPTTLKTTQKISDLYFQTPLYSPFTSFWHLTQMTIITLPKNYKTLQN